MKSYSGDELLQNNDKEKHVLSYDIDLTTNKTNRRSYDIDVTNKQSINTESSIENKKDKMISIAIICIGVIIFLLVLCMLKNISAINSQPEPKTESYLFKPQPKPSKTESLASKINFTEIDTEKDYILYKGDAIAFPCKSDNTDVYIEYIIDDLTTNNGLCNIVVSGGDTFQFVASDYILSDGPHRIMITQNAYEINDKTMTNVLDSTYSEINVEIKPDKKEGE